MPLPLASARPPLATSSRVGNGTSPIHPAQLALTSVTSVTSLTSVTSGWFKFGGVEFFKIQAVNSMGEQKGWDNRTSIYLGSAACAETIADIFLCPLEAVRIRLVSEPTYGGGSLPGAAAALVKVRM